MAWLKTTSDTAKNIDGTQGSESQAIRIGWLRLCAGMSETLVAEVVFRDIAKVKAL